VEHIQKFVHQENVRNSTIKNHFGHTWYGFETYKPFFHWSFLQALKLVILVSLDLIN
jgi:hypothetical protein